METGTISLKDRYEQAKAENPKMRIRDIARLLESSEAQLLATGIGESVTRLEGDFREFLKEVNTMGKVMALTRNNDCVHERKGVYNNVSFEGGHVGLVLDPDIDLRLFMMHWKYGFAVNENERYSFQFFDKSGEAVHKIYLTEESNKAAYEALKEKYKAADQELEITTETYAATPAEKPDAEIDVNGFREAWLGITDTHQFFGILKKFGVSRTQGLRLAPEGYARQLSNEAVETILQKAAEQKAPIMVFAGSRGCIQIHTGEVSRLVRTGPWYNVLDPDFNMHLRTDAIATTWLVRKPSEAGIVTSVEVFDKNGELIVQFFGKRKPGIPELDSWRTIAESVA